MKKAWICFTRIPEPGRTKTRLMPFLSGEECAALHTAFLRDLAVLSQEAAVDLFIAHTPGEGWEMLREIFPDAKDFFPQEGDDLGARMHHAMERVFALGCDACVLTGADLPRMTASHLASGFDALATADVVFGPTADGGYYLVGLKQPCRAVFEKQSYGGSTVLEKTLAAAKQAGLITAQALPCSDVDTAEELRALWQDCRGEDTHTARCLAELFGKKGRS